MAKSLIFAGACIASGLLLSGGASAASLPGISSLDAVSSPVETVGWRKRYWRRHGVWPSAPPAAAGDVVVDTANGPVVVAPLRPRSCGEYHYWNGSACIDARYNDPYLGPK